MTSLTLRGMRARKLRVALTSLAVLLGVMMIAGTYVFTDTINHSFDTIFKESNQGTDVVVKSKQAFTTDSGTLPPSFSESVLRRVERADGVGKAAGSVNDYASIFLSNGKQVKTTGAPPLLFSNVPEPFNPLDYVDGRGPDDAPVRSRSTRAPPTRRTSTSATRSSWSARPLREPTRCRESRSSAPSPRSAARRSRS